ncbi:hypothetical protein EVAR_96686_1 [Eumeta japonica]|uniref:Uncharacterized protein n=1 Tax=Eumeta variegata TaxID=151549 RepID=A0A4C1WHV2_EUMVA|nr:hypothetical protein EVAR_96686_1 [Eumeta japonica]
MTNAFLKFYAIFLKITKNKSSADRVSNATNAENNTLMQIKASWAIVRRTATAPPGAGGGGGRGGRAKGRESNLVRSPSLICSNYTPHRRRRRRDAGRPAIRKRWHSYRNRSHHLSWIDERNPKAMDRHGSLFIKIDTPLALSVQKYCHFSPCLIAYLNLEKNET